MTVRKSQDVAREAIAKGEIVRHDNERKELDPNPGAPHAEAREKEPADPPEAQKTQHDQGVNGEEEPPELTSEEREDLAEPDWEKRVEEISIDDLVTFDRANVPDNRFGNRWLCAGDTVVFQGETGVGKSVL